jgi:DNA-binding XRE family transcriptional regulator
MECIGALDWDALGVHWAYLFDPALLPCFLGARHVKRNRRPPLPTVGEDGRRPRTINLYGHNISIGIAVSSSKRNVRQNIDWKGVGRRLRELRGSNVTQQEFAERIGVSQGYLSHLERGEKEIGPEILLRISRSCHKSIEWLLTGKEPTINA